MRWRIQRFRFMLQYATVPPVKNMQEPVMSALSRKTLSIGIQTFSEVILEGHYYVDKTGFAQRLIARGNTIFCRARAASARVCFLVP